MKISACTFLTLWLLLFAFLVGHYGYDLWLRSDLPPGLIQAAGRIGGDPIPLPAGLPGKILKLTVKEGDLIEANQVVGELDGSSIQAELEEALHEHEKFLATRELLQSELEVMIKDAPISIQIAKAAWQKAEAKLGQSQAVEHRRKNSFLRLKKGAGKSDSDREELDEAELAFVRARTRRRTDEAEMSRLAEAVKLAELGYDKIRTAQEELSVLKTRIDEAERAIASVRALMGDPSIKAPIRGFITKRLLEIGDLAQRGQAVAEMADLDRLFLKVSIPEDQVTQLAVGMPARVWLELYPDTMLTARIGFIAADPDLAPGMPPGSDRPADGDRNETVAAGDAGQDANSTGSANPVPELANATNDPGRAQPVYGVKLYLDANPDAVAKPGQTGVAVIRFNEKVSWKRARRPYKK